MSRRLISSEAANSAAAIEDFYTEDCVLYVPPGVFVGHDALDKFAGDLRATHPLRPKFCSIAIGRDGPLDGVIGRRLVDS